MNLPGRTDAELALLFHTVLQALAGTAPGSEERRAVIDSLQNISKARAERHRKSTAPGL